ncbi:MAG: hypothetical protein Q7W54_00435, partial [Bacteroidota bacterium]|nr:hypothetical protein [Bacteroidota bacterium]
KLTYSDFKLFVGYTLADVNQQMNGVSTAFPLVATLYQLQHLCILPQKHIVYIPDDMYLP